MKNTSFILCVLAASPCLLSCGEGEVDREAHVVVEGRIMVDQDTPYSNENVYLHREATLWESFTDELFFAWYWLDCIFSELENQGSCGAWQTTRSDADGRYSFTFVGADTINEIDQLLDFQVSSVRGGFGDSEITLMTFQVKQETLAFSNLYFWSDPAPAEFTSTELVLDWQGEPVYGNESSGSTDFVFVQGHWEVFADFMDGWPVWEATAADGQVLELDARIFQDQPVSYSATDHTSTNQFSTTVRVERTSPTGFLDAQSHVPLSRGAACIYTTNLQTRTEDPCDLADGDFGTFFAGDEIICTEIPDEDACEEDAVEDVVVELDEVVSNPTLILHEFGGNVANQLTLSVSEDGVDYTGVTADVTSYSVLELEGDVRYLRFRREVEAGIWSGGMQHFLSELGVY